MARPENTLGYALHNWPNIIRTADHWDGLAPVQINDHYFTWLAPRWSIRCGVLLFRKYRWPHAQHGHDLHTVSALIAEWAPPPSKAPADHNDTAAYIKNMDDWGRFAPDSDPDLEDMAVAKQWITLIVHQEIGGIPRGDGATEIDAGVRLAFGLQPYP